MNDRPLLELPPLPAGVPRRDLRRDDRFDVVQTLEVTRAAAGAPGQPSLVSSAHGPIRHVMLWYPASMVGNEPYRDIYADLLRQLPETTRITLVAHPDSASDAEQLAGEHLRRDLELLTTPPWLNFSVWAEDACVVAEDVSAEPPVTYLMEPFSFTRYGDQVVADLVAQSSSLQSTQLPLQFQGGNLLIGDSFILVGRDYLDESIDVGLDPQPPIDDFPRDGTPAEQEAFMRELFGKALDPGRDIHFLESTPIDHQPARLVEQDGMTWLEILDAGWGRRQPIFHIDMFVTLAGRGEDGRYGVLVGDPGLADTLLSWPPVDHALQDEFDQVAAQLAELGFDVQRTPLPLVAERHPDPRMVQVGGEAVQIAGEIVWYHATANNCLVQIDGDAKDVWLPTYGHEGTEALAAIDAHHAETWSKLGFNVHPLGNFHPFARASGALHCIKKYIAR
jgi:hypothetical protein